MPRSNPRAASEGGTEDREKLGRRRKREESSSILILILSLTRPLIDFSKLYFLSGTKEDSRFVDLVNEYFDAHIFQFFEIQRTILLIS